jgi:hypothetical protein
MPHRVAILKNLKVICFSNKFKTSLLFKQCFKASKLEENRNLDVLRCFAFYITFLEEERNDWANIKIVWYVLFGDSQLFELQVCVGGGEEGEVFFLSVCFINNFFLLLKKIIHTTSS